MERRHINSYVGTSTLEMPVWTHDGPPPAVGIEYGVYTSLGPFRPNRLPVVRPHAYRVEHKAKHQPRVRGQFTKWAASVWREAGEFLVGAFQPIRDAI